MTTTVSAYLGSWSHISATYGTNNNNTGNKGDKLISPL